MCEECNRAKYTDEWVGGENNTYEVSDSISYKKLKQCPNCRTVVNHKAKKCIRCNYDFKKGNSPIDDELYEINSVQRQINSDNYNKQLRKEELKKEEELDKELIEIYGTRKCPNCGKEILNCALRCKYCKYSFKKDNNSNNNEKSFIRRIFGL